MKSEEKIKKQYEDLKKFANVYRSGPFEESNKRQPKQRVYEPAKPFVKLKKKLHNLLKP